MDEKTNPEKSEEKFDAMGADYKALFAANGLLCWIVVEGQLTPKMLQECRKWMAKDFIKALTALDTKLCKVCSHEWIYNASATGMKCMKCGAVGTTPITAL